MNKSFSFSQFKSRFSDDDMCLEEIKKMRYPSGIPCPICNRFTKHYRVTGRKAYSCKYCRNQVYPLKDTVFEKSSTPLFLWLYAMFIMTHIRGDISIITLQKELGVTYKTAWRIYRSIYALMEQNKGDLLADKEENRIHKWIFFNKFELSVTQKKEGV